MDVTLERGAPLGLAVVLLVAACGPVAQAPSEGGAAASPAAAQAVAPDATRALLTHCGVESLNIDGRWWNAVTPLYGPGGAGTGPPAGWSQPLQSGRLTLETSTRARFEAVGQVVVLTPSETGRPLRTCR